MAVKLWNENKLVVWKDVGDICVKMFKTVKFKLQVVSKFLSILYNTLFFHLTCANSLCSSYRGILYFVLTFIHFLLSWWYKIICYNSKLSPVRFVTNLFDLRLAVTKRLKVVCKSTTDSLLNGFFLRGLAVTKHFYTILCSQSSKTELRIQVTHSCVTNWHRFINKQKRNLPTTYIMKYNFSYPYNPSGYETCVHSDQSS